MISESPFTTIAEVAITLAGFSGLILVLRVHLTSQDKVRLLTILLQAIMISVIALLPFAIQDYDPNGTLVWSVPLFFYGCFSLLLMLYVLTMMRRGEFQLSNRGLAIGVTVPAFFVSSLSVLSAFGWPFRPSHGLLSLVLIWALFAMGMTFIITLQFSWGNDEA